MTPGRTTVTGSPAACAPHDTCSCATLLYVYAARGGGAGWSGHVASTVSPGRKPAPSYTAIELTTTTFRTPARAAAASSPRVPTTLVKNRTGGAPRISAAR